MRFESYPANNSGEYGVEARPYDRYGLALKRDAFGEFLAKRGGFRQGDCWRELYGNYLDDEIGHRLRRGAFEAITRGNY